MTVAVTKTNLRSATTYTDKVALPAFAAAHRCYGAAAAAADRRPAGRAAIDRYLLPAGSQQQTRLP